MQCNLFLLCILIISNQFIPVFTLNETSLETPINVQENSNSTEDDLGIHISKILNNFFTSGYDKRVRPNYGGKPVEVGITMFVISISSVSEVQMDFTSDFYFRQYWKDNRLSFPPTNGITQIFVGAEVSERIWLPDTFFANEKSAYFHIATTKNTFLRITSLGEVTRSIRLTVTASCPMDLQYFPMDRQLCSIEIESYGYSMSDIKYKWQPVPNSVGLAKELSLPQFKVLGHRQKEKIIDLTTGNYSRLICEIQFARSLGFYLIQIYIPASLIVVISWVSFWLHRNATPARVSLGVTTVLTMTTLMSSTNAQLPKISYIKSIDVFLGTCFVMVFGSLLEYAIVGYLGKRISMRKSKSEQLIKPVIAKAEDRIPANSANLIPYKTLDHNTFCPNPQIPFQSLCSPLQANQYQMPHFDNSSNFIHNQIHRKNQKLRPSSNLNSLYMGSNTNEINSYKFNPINSLHKNSSKRTSHSPNQQYSSQLSNCENINYNDYMEHRHLMPPIISPPANFVYPYMHYPAHSYRYPSLMPYPHHFYTSSHYPSYYNPYSHHLYYDFDYTSPNSLFYRQSDPFYRRTNLTGYENNDQYQVRVRSGARSRLNTQLSAYDPALEESRYSKYAPLSKQKQTFTISISKNDEHQTSQQHPPNLKMNLNQRNKNISNQKSQHQSQCDQSNELILNKQTNRPLTKRALMEEANNCLNNENNTNLKKLANSSLAASPVTASNCMITMSKANPSIGNNSIDQTNDANLASIQNLNRNKPINCKPLTTTTQLTNNQRATITATSTRTTARFNRLAKNTMKNMILFGSCKNPNKICGLSPSDIDKYSRVIFPVCFICFNLMYWVIYLHISDDIKADLVPLGS